MKECLLQRKDSIVVRLIPSEMAVTEHTVRINTDKDWGTSWEEWVILSVGTEYPAESLDYIRV
jgi:hypothetical protein